MHPAKTNVVATTVIPDCTSAWLVSHAILCLRGMIAILVHIRSSIYFPRFQYKIFSFHVYKYCV